MNLMPVMVDKSANPTLSNPSKTSSSRESNGQASEFDSILSDSLAQQTTPSGAADSMQEALSTLPILPSGGESLPLEGESLPPANLANAAEVLSEDPLTAAAGVALTIEGEGSVILPAADLQSAGLITGIAVQMSTASAALSAGMAGESVDKAQGQLNSASRQNVSGALFSPQTLSTMSLGQSAQTSSGEQGMNAQGQATPMPELTASTLEDKLDFGRIIEKGLVQNSKESTSTPLLSAIDTTKTGLGALKSATDSLQMQHTIDKPKWSNELGSRMVWLSKEGVQSAQLKLTPAHLGTIDVKISIQNDQATVSFLSQHGAVRDAIESSLPRLREMMQEAGVKLEQANISNHSNANAQHQSAHSGKTTAQSTHGSELASDAKDEIADTSLANRQTSDLTAIDFFA